MKKKTIIFHVGIPKTGTKSLQDSFVQLRDVLPAYDFSYPEDVFGTPDRTFDHYYLAKEMGRAYPGELGGFAKEFCDFIDSVGTTKVILSSEFFYNFSIVFLKFIDLIANKYDIKVLIYIRRQDRWFESQYMQYIKVKDNHGSVVAGGALEFEEWYEGARITGDFDAFIRNLEVIIGQENILIRRFDPQHIKSTLIEDAVAALGLPPKISNVNEQRLNRSLDPVYAEYMRQMNPAISEYADYVKIMVHLLALSNAGPVNEYSYFDSELSRRIQNEFREGNNRIAADYFDGSMPLFPEDTKKYEDKIRITSENSSQVYYEASRRLVQSNLEYQRQLCSELSRNINAVLGIVQDRSKVVYDIQEDKGATLKFGPETACHYDKGLGALILASSEASPSIGFGERVFQADTEYLLEFGIQCLPTQCDILFKDIGAESDQQKMDCVALLFSNHHLVRMKRNKPFTEVSLRLLHGSGNMRILKCRIIELL